MLEINNIRFEHLEFRQERGGLIPSFFLKLLKLRSICKDEKKYLVIKIPTASQIPFMYSLLKARKENTLFWIEGMPISLDKPKLLLLLLIKQPLLTLSRLLINNKFWFNFLSICRVDMVVSSKVQQKQIEPYLNEMSQISIIPNGSFHEGRDVPPTECIQRNEKLVFGYIGHAYHSKGIFDIVASLHYLQDLKHKFGIHLALSGLGDSINSEILSSGNLNLLGRVSPSDFYRNIDCLVAPYWFDWGTNTYPNVLLESLEFGVPVITTRSPLTQEIFSDPSLVLFTNVHDPIDLAKLLRMVVEKSISLPTSTFLRHHFANFFSRHVIERKWLFLLEERSMLHVE